MAMRWQVLQLADSAFPTGGFAHSAGLEAAVQLGEVRGGTDLERFARALAWNAGLGALPFVAAAHDAPSEVARHDALAEAFLTSQVANRASRTQGRAFVATCARVFDAPAVRAMEEAARTRVIAAHHAPLFGAVMAALDLPRAEALALYLHLTLRGVASAAVRLGVTGPHEAQRLLVRLGSTLDDVLAECSDLSPGGAALAAPLLELVGATHDHLYSRLFQS